MDRSADIAIVGSGIAGLAHAYAALKKGYRVVLFERDTHAVGASIRNFGLLWPIGQVPGPDLDRALRTREIWNDVAAGARVWLRENGSLHLAYNKDEWDVLQEFAELYKMERYQFSMLTPDEVISLSPHVRGENLKGGMLSTTEATVYSREAIKQIPIWLTEKFGLITRFGHAVKEVTLPHIHTTRESWTVKHVIICSGADFQSLYPFEYERQGLIKCKLQMMKGVMPKKFMLGPSLCAGLTLRHYKAFENCKSLKALSDRFDAENPFLHENGIHVLVSQNQYGELILGDSHHYSSTPDPFDFANVDDAVLQYLDTFMNTNGIRITERWNGVYPKLKSGTHMVVKPQPGVTIVNGLGGAGMTLSFGLAEEVVASL
ncbi:MAG TPA: TIGR03364 family FAD-dependent oxidoreductase [Chryseosolibacter sp.]